MSEENMRKIAVIYTDGGARPNPGFAGWGAHGYVAKTEKPKKGAGCSGMLLTTEGYIPKAKALADKKEEVTVETYFDAYGPVGIDDTNNIAELVAAIRVMAWALTADITELVIRPDSQYFKQGLEDWLPGWKKKDWVKSTGTPVANAEYWKQLDVLNEQLKEKDIKLTLLWVKGHSDEVGNNRADELATAGLFLAKSSPRLLPPDVFKVTPPDGYWKSKSESNRMLSLSRWYFTSAMESMIGDRHMYCMGEHGTEDELLGKAISDTIYSVVLTHDKDPILEEIKSKQLITHANGFNNLYIARTDHIFNSKTYDKLFDFGMLTVQPQQNKPDLYDGGNLQLTKFVTPPRLAFRAINSLNVLTDILTAFKPEGFDNYVVTDITDVLYDEKVGKKKTEIKLKSTINSSMKALEIDVNYNTSLTSKDISTSKVTLSVGIDIAKRNTLSALATRKPKVYVVSWRESDSSFRYATIIEANSVSSEEKRDIGIWAGVYSNLRVLAKR